MDDAVNMIWWPGKKMGRTYKLVGNRIVEVKEPKIVHDTGHATESENGKYIKIHTIRFNHRLEENMDKKHYTADGVEIVRDGVYRLSNGQRVAVLAIIDHKFPIVALNPGIPGDVDKYKPENIHSIPKPIEAWANFYPHNSTRADIATMQMEGGYASREAAESACGGSALATRKLRWDGKKIIDVTDE